MKRQIRQGVWETNSSNTHSLTICSKKTFYDWKNGKLLHDKYGDGEFIPCRQYTEEEKEKIVEQYYESNKKPFYKNYKDLTKAEKNRLVELAIKDGLFKDNPEDECYETYEEWQSDEYLETYSSSFTTEHGDEVVAFGKYGYDG